MDNWLGVFVLVILILVGYALALLNAPEGYEDERGFHFGRQEDAQ
jgi:hypothetical protein